MVDSFLYNYRNFCILLCQVCTEEKHEAEHTPYLYIH